MPKDQTLLDKNQIIINNEGISKADIAPYIRQTPNKRIFGAKFHLGLYNLSNINKEKWPHTWLREIGEEPVIFDPYTSEKTLEQIKSYIASKGYFDSRVTENLETVDRKSQVFYNIDLKTPYTIRNVYYEFADSTIEYLFDTVNCLIEKGKPYDVDVIQAERTRFERFIRDQGFYEFSGDHIYFRIDSTVGKRQVDIFYGVKNAIKVDANSQVTTVPHSVYYIRNVYIYPDFVPKEALEGGESYINSLDTTVYKNYYFISPKDKPGIKYDLIIQSLYLRPGSRYTVSSTEQSQAHLTSLKTFRLVNIFYNEVSDNYIAKGSGPKLDCIIQLTPLSQQSYKVEVEGTRSDGIGGALNLSYQHKNFFHGAELFNLKLKGAYETFKQNDSTMHSFEYGAETSLRFPKFLLPFLKKEDFIRKYNPTTTLLAAYNHQKMPFYTRTIANATFGYNWNGNSYTTHIVNPVQLNFVKLYTIDPVFWNRIKSSSLAYSYSDVIILGGNYSLIFNNQIIPKTREFWRDSWFLRFNAETSGNMLGLVSKLAKADKTRGSYQIFKQPFAQYFRADVDLRYNVTLNDVSSFVLRGFAGAGIPYGNSVAIPFEKQYFGGGANGIRAWQVRSLGPGSYRYFFGPWSESRLRSLTTFLNQTADIKLEANAEYRFKLFWILEGSLFLDAGNIWTYKYLESEDDGSQFKFKEFYRDIAVGTGAGIRFDLDFVLLRADFGLKLLDPGLSEGSRWVLRNWSDYSRKVDNVLTFVVGIGYPF